MAADEITAVKTRSTFQMQCAVSAEIQAAPEKVWALLTRADDMVRWNSTLTSVEGNVEPGATVRMQVPEAPGRTFKVKVTRFVPNQEMVWRDGNPVMFLGVRTYSLTPSPDGTGTRFQMTEVFSGLLLPIIAGRLPDFGPIFERYAADLKAEAESDLPSSEYRAD
ncbi:MAG: SRPBCC family protein [Jiangellaceae bacterium]